MSVSNITNICSLLISVVALAVSIVGAIRTARLATAQTRTELLTKLYYAQVVASRRRAGDALGHGAACPDLDVHCHVL
jgi:hypothetical protein